MKFYSLSTPSPFTPLCSIIIGTIQCILVRLALGFSSGLLGLGTGKVRLIPTTFLAFTEKASRQEKRGNNGALTRDL